MSDPITAAAITAGGSLLGGSGLFKGKKTEMTSPLSKQGQEVSNQMGNYISQGMNKPIAYAGVNPLNNTIMDTFMRMFFGKPYSYGPSYSAQGGGIPQTPYGMPQQMGPQMPPGIPPQGFQPGMMPGRAAGGAQGGARFPGSGVGPLYYGR